MTLVRNAPTPDGYALGGHLARFVTQELQKALAKFPNHVQPCETCAFRRGTFANGCGVTLMEALKCVMERSPFYCHEKQNDGRVCAGWFVLQSGAGAPVKAPWKFSYEYPEA